MTGIKSTNHHLSSNDDADDFLSTSQYSQLLLPVSTVKSFFELSGLGIDDKMVDFSKFDKRMLLVANVASGDKNATREFTQVWKSFQIMQ